MEWSTSASNSCHWTVLCRHPTVTLTSLLINLSYPPLPAHPLRYTMVRYVAGDIGGTNSRLQLIELPVDERDGQFNQELERVVAEETYPSQKYASLTFIIQKFLEAYNKDAEPAIACCLAVAGPVRSNKSIITNVNWVLDGEEMAENLKMKKVQIINDVSASTPQHDPGMAHTEQPRTSHAAAHHSPTSASSLTHTCVSVRRYRLRPARSRASRRGPYQRCPNHSRSA